MKIAIGSDHAGFALKQQVADALRAEGHEVHDFGTNSTESTDYPDYAAAVGRDVSSGASDRGILVCDTGVGMAIAANKINGIRAGLAVNDEEVARTREHNNANVLTIGARYTDFPTAKRFLDIFLNTPFDTGERHERRVGKIMALERK